MTTEFACPPESTAAEVSDRRAVLREAITICETPENWTIYHRPDLTDPTFLELCASIRKSGVNTPLEISDDGHIISGHRRFIAAQHCGINTLPCFIDHAVVMSELDGPERIALLTERNRGIRVKTDSELYLEAAASVDPVAAIHRAQARKAQVLNKSKTCGLTEVAIAGSIARTDPSGEREEMLKAVMGILAELRSQNFLPTSGRSIHYKLLQMKVRTSARKNGYIYGTRPGSASLLSKLLTDARSAGLIAHADLDDGTRPTHQFTASGNLGTYINKTLGDLFMNYFFDVHADQPNHVEMLVEKNTIFPLLYRHVAHRLRVPITSLRGYGSFPAARDVAERFKRSGKEKLVVIYASDLDPEGVNMPASWKKYLKYDFEVEAQVYRAAVTPEQVKKFQLPPDADVKLTSSRAAGFMELHGDQCWELDSMPEQVLIDEVSNAVRAVLDIPALNRAFEREKEADVKLARLQAAVTQFVTQQCQEAL